MQRMSSELDLDIEDEGWYSEEGWNRWCRKKVPALGALNRPGYEIRIIASFNTKKVPRRESMLGC